MKKTIILVYANYWLAFFNIHYILVAICSVTWTPASLIVNLVVSNEVFRAKQMCANFGQKFIGLMSI